MNIFRALLRPLFSVLEAEGFVKRTDEEKALVELRRCSGANNSPSVSATVMEETIISKKISSRAEKDFKIMRRRGERSFDLKVLGNEPDPQFGRKIQVKGAVASNVEKGREEPNYSWGIHKAAVEEAFETESNSSYVFVGYDDPDQSDLMSDCILVGRIEVLLDIFYNKGGETSVTRQQLERAGFKNIAIK